MPGNLVPESLRIATSCSRPPTRPRLYIDRHLIHEVTSPQAFDGLRLAGREVLEPDLTIATVNHNVPTENQLDIREPMSRRQVEALRDNCREFGLTLFDVHGGRQGIVHVIGPGTGPDPARARRSSAATATPAPTASSGPWPSGSDQRGRARPRDADPLARAAADVVRHRGRGKLAPGLEPKDIILAIIRADRHRRGDGDRRRILRPGDRGPLDGRPADDLQHVDRGRARAGLIAPDDTTIQYLAPAIARSPPRARRSTRPSPTGRRLKTDDPSAFDRHVVLEADKIAPQVTWGTNPAMTVDVTGRVPEPDQVPFSSARTPAGARLRASWAAPVSR